MSSRLAFEKHALEVKLDNFQGIILIFTLLVIVFVHFHP